jgi:regulator of nucleoside diphosphate kinase
MERESLIMNKMDHIRINKCIRDAIVQKTMNKFEIERIKLELEKARIVEPHEVPNNIVTMNSVVKISFPDVKKQVQLKIVYPHDANISDWKISIFSPIANALLGCKVGDTIEWFVPAGGTTIKIDEIIYQPEASGNFNE